MKWKLKNMLVNKRPLLLLLLMLVAGTLAHAQTSVDRVVAKVGDKIVLHSDIEAQLKEARKEGIEVGPESYCVIMEELLFQKLLTYQAQLDSIEVTEQEVEGELDARFNYLIQQGGGSREELEKFYGKTVEQMKDELREPTRERLLAQRMQQSITKDVNITPREVKEYYEGIPVDSLPFMGSKVEFAQIAIVPKISEAEKKQMYKKLEKIRSEIISGEMSFCTGAAVYSCDPGTNEKCGEFEFVTRGTFVPEFDAAAFSLKEKEVSEIFETQFGYHILQLLERRGEMYRGRHILICFQPSEINLQKAAKRLDSVYNAIKSGSITFEEAVIKFSTDETTKHNQGKAINEYTGDSRYDIRDLDKQTFIV
ncbi:MAG: peptidylprolyl isomerase, partial [Flavobacteriales bacterium]